MSLNLKRMMGLAKLKLSPTSKFISQAQMHMTEHHREVNEYASNLTQSAVMIYLRSSISNERPYRDCSVYYYFFPFFVRRISQRCLDRFS